MNLLEVAALSWLVWAGYWILARGFVKTTKSTESAALGMLHVVPLAVGIYLISRQERVGCFVVAAVCEPGAAVRWRCDDCLWVVVCSLEQAALGRVLEREARSREGTSGRSGPYRRSPSAIRGSCSLIASRGRGRDGGCFHRGDDHHRRVSRQNGTRGKVLTLEFGEKYRTYTHERAAWPFVTELMPRSKRRSPSRTPKFGIRRYRRHATSHVMHEPKGGEARAPVFYGELLGLREVPNPESIRSRGGVWFEAGGLDIHISVEEQRGGADVIDILGWRCGCAASESGWGRRAL